MAQSNPYPLRIDKSIMDKFKVIATNNGRSINKEIEVLMKFAISDFEDKFGVISPQDQPE